MNKTVAIYSKFPLVRERLAYSLEKIEWNVILDGESMASPDASIVEVFNYKDLEILDELDAPVVIFSRLPETKLIGLLFD